jgi:hypothetical protein
VLVDAFVWQATPTRLMSSLNVSPGGFQSLAGLLPNRLPPFRARNRESENKKLDSLDLDRSKFEHLDGGG